MTIFSDLMAEVGLPAMFEIQGETATYLPKDGKSRTITIIKHDFDRVIDRKESGEVFEITRILLTAEDHATRGINSPRPEDSLTLFEESDLVTYVFEELLTQTGGTTIVRFKAMKKLGGNF